MRSVPVSSAGAVGEEVVQEVEAAVGSLHLLADVLEWGGRELPPARIVDIVTQDEYTHDVVVPFRGRAYLSFDTT